MSETQQHPAEEVETNAGENATSGNIADQDEEPTAPGEDTKNETDDSGN